MGAQPGGPLGPCHAGSHFEGLSIDWGSAEFSLWLKSICPQQDRDEPSRGEQLPASAAGDIFPWTRWGQSLLPSNKGQDEEKPQLATGEVKLDFRGKLYMERAGQW